MGSAVLGELLILFLLVLNCSRMFFLKYGKVDSLTILAPVCVILSLLQIFSWNADFFSVTLLVISIFCFFTNFRALLRFCSGLYVDHYSVAFKTGAFLILVLSLAETALLIWFYPKEIQSERYDVSVEKIRVSGNFTGGFEESGLFSRGSGTIYRYEPKNQKKLKPETIILLSDKRADSRSYVPYMQMLAKSGYRVYTGDFYSRDLKWLHSALDLRFFRRVAMLFEYQKNPVQFMAQKEFYAWNMRKELDVLLKYVQEDLAEELVVGGQQADETQVSGFQTSPFFVIGDWMADVALDDFIKSQPENVLGILKLSEIPEYSTPGFGFIKHIFPLDAWLLGFERNRAPGLEEIQVVTEKTVEMLPEHPELEEQDEPEESKSEMDGSDLAEKEGEQVPEQQAFGDSSASEEKTEASGQSAQSQNARLSKGEKK